MSTAEPHGIPETSTTLRVGHGLFRERGPRKVSSVAQALWMTSPTCPPQPRRRRKGGNFLEKYQQCLSRRCEYGGAARNTVERGPRKVSSVAQALWMTSPTCPPQPRRRRKGGNFLEKYQQCLSRRCEYGGAARNTGERGPRKVPEAFGHSAQKTRGPWPKGGNFSGNMGELL